MARIGFIGLGNMGAGMAANLVKAGHAVRAFDIAAEVLRRSPAAHANSVADAVAKAEVVITMLPAAAHVRAVYEAEVFGVAPLSAMLIDCSTIDVATARDLAKTAAARGYQMADAPVSGGVAASAAGTLTFMVGASADGFARAEPVLARMGKAVIHAGAAGAGDRLPDRSPDLHPASGGV